MNGDQALEREMLDGFRQAGLREVESLGQALAARECDRVRSAAHRLKGLARLVAAPSLAAVCEGIEASAKAGALDEVTVARGRFDPSNGTGSEHYLDCRALTTAPNVV